MLLNPLIFRSGDRLCFMELAPAKGVTAELEILLPEPEGKESGSEGGLRYGRRCRSICLACILSGARRRASSVGEADWTSMPSMTRLTSCGTGLRDVSENVLGPLCRPTEAAKRPSLDSSHSNPPPVPHVTGGRFARRLHVEWTDMPLGPREKASCVPWRA